MSRMSASVAKARASPTRCCMPPDNSWTCLSAHCVNPTMLELLVDDAVALGGSARRAVRGRSRHSRAPFATAAGRTAGTPSRRCGRGRRAASARCSGPRRSAVAVMLDQNLAARHLVEAVDGAQKRRLAGAGQPHQHADLAALDGRLTPAAPRTDAGRWPISRRGSRPSSISVERRLRVRAPKTMSTFSNLDRGHRSAPPLGAIRAPCRPGRARWRAPRWRRRPRSPWRC